MIYYNQNNYGNIPYPAPGYPNATVKSGGCGVCCMSMVMENFGYKFPVKESAEFSRKCGARVSGGTDLGVFLNALKDKLTWKQTTDWKQAEKELKNGAFVICNSKGGVNGLFSDGGHYVLAYEMVWDTVKILDPGYYAGKYNTKSRKNRATVSGNTISVKSFDVAADCKKYYIIRKVEKKMTVDEAKTVLKTKAGLSDKTIEFLYNYRYGDDLILKIAKAMQ